MKIGKSEYQFSKPSFSDYCEFLDSKIQMGSTTAIALLLSKHVIRDGVQLQPSEIPTLDGRVAQKFLPSLATSLIKPLDGKKTVEEVIAGRQQNQQLELTENFEIQGRIFDFNPDYTTVDYTNYLENEERSPGNSLKGIVCSYFLVNGKKITKELLEKSAPEGLGYGVGVFFYPYFKVLFTDTPTE